MPHAVNIPGVGRVNFPDTMSPEDINREATTLFHSRASDPRQAPPIPAPAPIAAHKTGLMDAVAGAYGSAHDILASANRPRVNPADPQYSIEGMKAAPPMEDVAGVGKAIVQGPKNLYTAAKTGDYGLAGQGLVETAVNTLPLVRGVTEPVRGLPAKVGSTALELGLEAGSKAVSKGRELVTGIPLKPEAAMVKAIKPRASNLQFEMNLQKAMPELKALGRDYNTIDDLIAGTKDAKRGVWDQYQKIKGPQAQRGIAGDAIADAMEQSVPLKVRVQDPARAEGMMARANSYRGRTFKIDELEDILHTTNAELDAYYDKYPAAKRAAAARNPETAGLVAEGEKLRETIYNALDPNGEGGAARELKQRYGSLMNLEEEAMRRRNVALRQQPESLTQQMGRLQAGVNVGKGIFRMATGSPLRGAADIAGAYAGRKIATAIKDANSTNTLIRNAMAKWETLPEALNYTPKKPAGLLGPGAIQVGPVPDESFVRGVPAELSKKRLLLAERAGSLVTPPPADPSAVRGIDARFPTKKPFKGFQKTGKAITGNRLQDAIDNAAESRMSEMNDSARSGWTERTGKVQRVVNPDNPNDKIGVGRFGGGFKNEFPELKGFKESPSRIADAIERDQNNPLYLKVKSAVKESLPADEIQTALDPTAAFDFGSNAPPRNRLLEQVRRFTRQRK